ncbi:hypothetical protein RDI58_015954 [Solanum bulbocastanum]|uniref:Uncharacterized protein n=1 Tax=Solanum bulbocastanum TaxID=147425 RepID=A0AAN8TIR8_SOLBU
MVCFGFVIQRLCRLKESGGNKEDFIQFLRDKLMQREIVPVCCDSRRFKCWRYCLKLKLKTPLYGMGILLHHLKPRPFVSN